MHAASCQLPVELPCLSERECVFRRNNVSSRETMCLPEKQCVFWRANVSPTETMCVSAETMCFPERQCVFRRDNVFSGETMCLRDLQCVFERDNVSSGETMWLPETGCPGHKLTSRSSPDMFPASNRTKTIRLIHWSDQNCSEWFKNHENHHLDVFLVFNFLCFISKL